MKEGLRWQRHDASTDRVTHTLHPRPVDEQQGTCHHEEERDPVPASRLGPDDHQENPTLSRETIRGEIMHAAENKQHRCPFRIPNKQWLYHLVMAQILPWINDRYILSRSRSKPH